MGKVGEALRDALLELFLPLIAAAKYDSGWRGLLISLGHTEQVASDPGLHAALEQTATLVESLSAIDLETLLSWEGLQEVAQIGSDANSVVRAFQQAASNPALANRIADLGEELMEQLVGQYLRNNHRVLFRVSSALTIITPAEFAPVEPAQFDGSTVTRLPWQHDRFRFDRIDDLVSAPWNTLLESYFPNNLAEGADAHHSAALLFPQLGALADSLRLSWRSDVVSALRAQLPEPPFPDDPALGLDHFGGEEDTQPDVDVSVSPPPDLTSYYAGAIPRFLFALPRSDGGPDPHFAIALLLFSAQHPDGVAGLIVTPVGTFNSTELRGSWRITITSNGQIPAFVAGPSGFSLAPSGERTRGSVRMILERLPPTDASGPAFVFGSAEGTRLELGNLRLVVNLSSDAQRATASIALAATSGALILAPGDGDGFLRAVLPAKGPRIDFDLGFELSSTHGLRLQGAGGLDATLPVGLSIGSVSVPTIHLGLHANDAGLGAEVSASVGLSIGPVHALVDRVGITTSVSFPEKGGNLGVADLDIGFKPPSGIGIKVDSPFVTGGGFLSFDQEKGEYAGAILLNLEGGITVTAIGVIATKLPNHAQGFSFVVMITAQGFKPIPLGLGFTLTAIGGLLAINRTCNEEFLREGIQNNTLNHLLFPKDPIRNAPQIFGTLNKAFPPSIGSYLFGPVVQICWGTPPVLTMDLALVLELGNRRRLLILGRVSAILPTEKHDQIRLQMNAFGVIDFDQKSISLDAILYDSRLVGKFPITGSMAMRLRWGSAPVFALSIGGFHPAFKPPPSFPVLKRLAISLSNTDNFRLRLECYLAITSNTLQFGAKVELMARAGRFSIEGRLSFDVLIQFDPFFFQADFQARVQLKLHSHNLFSVDVKGELSGPRPLHIKGKATFGIFWCHFSVRFDKTLVEGERPRQLEAINVLEQLIVALKDSRNWSGQLAEGERRAVTLREAGAADHIPLHPLGRLSVKQTVVPLELEISKFGNRRPADVRLFKINSLSVNGTETDFTRVKDFFAPGQFLDLSEDERLAAPSFEAMVAGISVGAEGFLFTTNDENILEDGAITYETIIVDKEFEAKNDKPRQTAPFVISAEFLNRHISLGAAAHSDIRRTGTAKYRFPQGDESRSRPPASKNLLDKKGWTIASTEDGSHQGAPGFAAGKVVSYAESFQALQRLKRENPAKAKTLMLIRVSKK